MPRSSRLNCRDSGLSRHCSRLTLLGLRRPLLGNRISGVVILTDAPATSVPSGAGMRAGLKKRTAESGRHLLTGRRNDSRHGDFVDGRRNGIGHRKPDTVQTRSVGRECWRGGVRAHQHWALSAGLEENSHDRRADSIGSIDGCRSAVIAAPMATAF